jgi:hypothetical protein
MVSELNAGASDLGQFPTIYENFTRISYVIRIFFVYVLWKKRHKKKCRRKSAGYSSPIYNVIEMRFVTNSSECCLGSSSGSSSTSLVVSYITFLVSLQFFCLEIRWL